MTDDLLPCPFCGNAASIGKTRFGWFVNCVSCLASTNIHVGEQETPQQAIAVWNRRIDALAAENARLKELVASPPIKPLVWGQHRNRKYKSFDGQVHRADTIFGCYEIWHYGNRDGDQFHLHYQGKWFAILEAAKAAAQQDYESRIRAALATPPSP